MQNAVKELLKRKNNLKIYNSTSVKGRRLGYIVIEVLCREQPVNQSKFTFVKIYVKLLG